VSSGGVDYKAQVLQAIDIVQLIGQSVALKRRGRSFVGLCPFHQEKTPSFTVDPSKQVFYCFGCKASGNAIDFVMKRDRISNFLDALKMLGAQLGIEMPRFGATKEKNSERQVLLEANSAACMLFEKLLSHSEKGKAAREYLLQRGFNAESIKRFQIGVADAAWDTLANALSRKFTPQQLQLAGLVKARQQGEGVYDTFRNRLMFPIRDESSRIIAFGGRVMPGSEDPAKYLNSPETPLFSKSKSLFGLDLARSRIVEKRVAIVVEGYTDVVMAHQFGVTNVVSALGTALTEQHVGILRRFADKVVLLFDADEAGDMAADRIVELFLSAEVEIAVASMPAGLDPDEYLLKHGPEEFDKLIAAAPDALNYVWKQMRRQFQATDDNITQQQKLAEKYLELLGTARGKTIDPLRWGKIISDASDKTGIPTDILLRRFSPRRTTKGQGPRTNVQTQVSTENQPTEIAPAQPQGILAAQKQVLGALLSEPGRWQAIQQNLHPEDFSNESCRKLAEVYWDHNRHEGEPVFSEFVSQLNEELKQLAFEAQQAAEEFGNLDRTLDEAMKYLSSQRDLKKHKADLERTTDEDEFLKKTMEQARKGDLRRA